MPRTNTFRSLLLTTISIAALTACSSDGGDVNKSAAPMPPISEIDTAMAEPVSPVTTLDASDTITPILPSAAAQSATGDTDDRIAKLEQSVNALRADYDRIMPAFASLNTTNARIQTLLGEIEKDTGKVAAVPVATPAATTTTVTTVTKAGTVSSPTPLTSSTTTTATTDVPVLSAPPLSSFKAQPTPEEARAEAQRQMAAAKPASLPEAKLPETKTEAKITPAAGASVPTGANSVKGIRIGEHGSKTRLVLDLSANAKPAFKYDLDNGEKVLLVELPASGWAGAQSGTPKSPLIESWTVQKTPEGGSTLAIQLKKDARVLSTEFLKPEGPDSARLVMDIASAS